MKTVELNLTMVRLKLKKRNNSIERRNKANRCGFGMYMWRDKFSLINCFASSFNSSENNRKISSRIVAGEMELDTYTHKNPDNIELKTQLHLN